MAAILELPEFEGPEGHSISEIEIREAINKLKYGKASGVDCISTDLLKICAGNRHMLVSLAVIFSQCLRESRNPADWQIALVKTLFKKGDRHSWKNYRLISLLSVVGKLYESVLANRLSCLLDGCAGSQNVRLVGLAVSAVLPVLFHQLFLLNPSLFQYTSPAV